MDPHSRVPKKNTSHGNEVLLQDTTHLIQRPCYQRGSPCQDPAGNRTTRKPPYHRKETQTAVVLSCFPLIMSGLAKTILQGTVKGGRRQGRQRKRWEDNIRKWTGLEFAKSQRAVENRGNWKKLIENSSMVPQRPSRLRNRGDEVKITGQLCDVCEYLRVPIRLRHEISRPNHTVVYCHWQDLIMDT